MPKQLGSNYRSTVAVGQTWQKLLKQLKYN